ncbi:MAG: XRE family transcriptional regulator [Rhizonema sp. NSF051]|nr:XRE family transcriptional regulator [Rhizonema sp. NSF051]
MTERKLFSELTREFSPERKAKIASLTNQLREEITFQELRLIQNQHQTDLSEQLGVKQGAVSPMENRKDIYVSQLKKVVEAMGGELVITARFPDMEVRINPESVRQ